jgi:hypothetical protein
MQADQVNDDFLLGSVISVQAVFSGDDLRERKYRLTLTDDVNNG